VAGRQDLAPGPTLHSRKNKEIKKKFSALYISDRMAESRNIFRTGPPRNLEFWENTLAIAEAKYCGRYPDLNSLLFSFMASVLQYYNFKDYQATKAVSLSGAIILKTLAIHGYLSGHRVSINYEPSPVGPSRRKVHLLNILKDVASLAKVKPKDEVCETGVSLKLASVLSFMLAMIATNTRASLEEIVRLRLHGPPGAYALSESEYTSEESPDV